MNIEQEYIKNVTELPPCPEIALEVLTIAQDVDCNFKKLAAKIERDPNLTANMLKMANSVFFGHMKQIGSIKDIIVRLGLENIKLIAITSASAAILRPPKEAYGLESGALWRHSYATAVLASIIGKFANASANATLYTSALLHDVGKVILDRPLWKEIYNQDIPDEEMSFIDFENYILHTNHAKVGMALLERWGLPENVCIPVGRHHVRNQVDDDSLHSKIVYLANLLIENMGILLTDSESYNFEVREQEDPQDIMQEIPNFETNKEKIIDQFFEEYSNGLAFL